MADPTAIRPYHDPYDDPLDDEYLNFITDQRNPTLASLSSSINDPPSSSAARPNDGVSDPLDPLDDPMIWDICNQVFNQGNSQNDDVPGPSSASGGRGAGGAGRTREKLPQPGLLDGGKFLSVWPPPPVPFGCTCCQVLREIIHTDGNYTTKLEIHGRLGMICHAVLETWDHISTGPSHPQHHMFDFCKKSIEDVKQFLLLYCDDRRKSGYVMVQDPLSMFYEALTVGLDSDENYKNDEFFDRSPTNSGERLVDLTVGENDAERLPRTNLALQRERAGKLTLLDFKDYFHLPIEEAARRMNLCPTVVKKICRRDGMTRWPHRKIKSLQRQITNLEALVNSNIEEERVHAQVEIQRLQQEIANLCSAGRSTR